jgi:putative hydrolase of the HAD superfamily
LSSYSDSRDFVSPVRKPSRLPVWLFDLDNTLHNASPLIFPRINRAMTDFIIRELRVDEAAAHRLRVDYWVRYGATLSGLVRHHDIDPHHFLRDTHQFPDLARILSHDRATGHLLDRLPGRKVLFSNAPAHYARAILRAMKVEHRFSAVFTIENLRFRPKPQTAAYIGLLAELGVPAADCILVEDTVANLKPAKALGMKTVWLSRSSRQPAQVDIRVTSLRQLVSRFGQPPSV